MPHHDGIAYKISGPRPPGECYPATGTYTFGEFAGPVFEHGGDGENAAPAFEFGAYGDMSLVDPWTGRRLWVAVFNAGQPMSVYDAMRKVIEIAEATGFLAPYDERGETEPR